jgi:hypothetical protein
MTAARLVGACFAIAALAGIATLLAALMVGAAHLPGLGAAMALVVAAPLVAIWKAIADRLTERP